MSRELTNLLPEDRLRAFKRRYLLRLATLVLVVLTVVVVLNGILLLPSYLYARSEVARGREALAAIDTAQLSQEEEAARARAARLKLATDNLARLEGAPVATAALRAVLAVPRTGVALTGFTYDAALAADAPNRMTISGVASSREALRSYVAALDALPFVDSADLPISAYARETVIPFTVTLSGTLRP